MIREYIRVEMISFCCQIFFACCVDPAHGQDSLLSPTLERWNIVPDPFIIYRAMYNEVDHRTYHNFDGQQWRPSIKWNDASHLSPYELSVLALIILLMIFAAICILSFTYLFYYIIYHFCFTRCRKDDEVKYTSILTKDLVDSRVVNV